MKRILLATAFTVLSSTLFSSVSFALYTPQEALRDALSEPLKFVGYYVPKYSESQKYPNCIWRNSKTLVMSSYCVRGNVPAGSAVIHSTDKTKGYARIYTEVQDTKSDISTASPSKYLDFLLSVSARISEQDVDMGMSAKEYEKWEERENKNFTQYCVTNLAFKDDPYSTVCRDLTNELHVWGPHGYEFWKNPDSNWPKFLKTIKAQVRRLPNYPY